ncbi:MAG: glycosyltransferase family 39 protein [Aggregatilineales bacterium]
MTQVATPSSRIPFQRALTGEGLIYARLIALTVIFLVASTRILNIDGPSLWIDEGFTWYTFRGDLFELVKADRHPPLYFYALHAWSAFTGESVLALRFWSFLPGMVSIAVIYQIGRELARERLKDAPEILHFAILGVPVLAALLMALADGENYLAQELRMYTWQVLLCASATWFYLRWTRTFSRRDGALWWLFMTLALYTHYFSAYVIAAHLLHALIFLRGKQRLFAVGIVGLVGVAFLPWFFAVMREQFFDSDVCVNCGSAIDLETLRSFRLSWFGEQWIFMLLLAILGLIRVYYHWKPAAVIKIVPSRNTCLILFLGILPLIFTYLLSHRSLVFFNQHFAQLTIPVVLLIALGLSNIQRPARVILVVMIVLYGVTHVDWYRQKAPWEQVVNTIQPYVASDELVLAEVGAENAALWYYIEHDLPEGVQIGLNPWWGNIENPEFYQQTLPALISSQSEVQNEHVKTIWLIHWNASQTMFTYLAQFGYVPTMQTTTYHLGTIPLITYRYDLLPASPLTSYENGMILNAVNILQDDLRVDLWWSTESAQTTDYVTSVRVFDADNSGLVAQYDSQPQNGARSTTTFEVGEVIYDPKPLEIVDGLNALPAGNYRVELQVYRFDANGDIIPVETIDGQPHTIIGNFDVE